MPNASKIFHCHSHLPPYHRLLLCSTTRTHAQFCFRTCFVSIRFVIVWNIFCFLLTLATKQNKPNSNEIDNKNRLMVNWSNNNSKNANISTEVYTKSQTYLYEVSLYNQMIAQLDSILLNCHLKFTNIYIYFFPLNKSLFSKHQWRKKKTLTSLCNNTATIYCWFELNPSKLLLSIR